MTIAFYLNQWPNSKAPHSVALAGAWKVVVSARPGNAAGQGHMVPVQWITLGYSGYLRVPFVNRFGRLE